MKKLLSIILAALCVVSTLPATMMSNVSAYDENRKYYVRSLDSSESESEPIAAPTIDGEFNDPGLYADSDWEGFKGDGKLPGDKFVSYYDTNNVYFGVQIENDVFHVRNPLAYWWAAQSDTFNLWIDPLLEGKESGNTSNFQIYVHIGYQNGVGECQPSILAENSGTKIQSMLNDVSYQIASNFQPDSLIKENEDGSTVVTRGKQEIPGGLWKVEIQLPVALFNKEPGSIVPFEDMFAMGIWVREVGKYYDDIPAPGQGEGPKDWEKYENRYSSGKTGASFNHHGLIFATQRPGEEVVPPIPKEYRDLFENGEEELDKIRPEYIGIETKTAKLDAVINSDEYSTSQAFEWLGATLEKPSDFTNATVGERWYKDENYSFTYDKDNIYIGVKTTDKKITRNVDKANNVDNDYVRIAFDPEAELKPTIGETANGVELYVLPSVGQKYNASNEGTGDYIDIKDNIVVNSLGTELNAGFGGDKNAFLESAKIQVKDNAKNVNAENTWTVEVAIPWKVFGYSAKDVQAFANKYTQLQILTFNPEYDRTVVNGNGMSSGGISDFSSSKIMALNTPDGKCDVVSKDASIEYTIDKDFAVKTQMDLAHTFDAAGKTAAIANIPVTALNKIGYGEFAIDFGKNMPRVTCNTSLLAKDWFKTQNGDEGTFVELDENDVIRIDAKLVKASDYENKKILEKFGADQQLVEINTFLVNDNGTKQIIPAKAYTVYFDVKPVDDSFEGIVPVVFDARGTEYPLNLSNIIETLVDDGKDENGDQVKPATYTYEYAARSNSNGVYGIANYDKKEFTDAKSFDDWAVPYINLLTRTGIINGNPDGSFAPRNNITREQTIWMIARLFAFNTNIEDSTQFPDVLEGNYGKNIILIGKELGIVNGRPNGNFDPAASVSRLEFAAFLARAIKENGFKLPVEVDPTCPNVQSFKDKETIAKWGWEDLELVLTSKLMKGDQNNNFRPNDPITRQEASTTLGRFFNYFVFQTETMPK